MVSNVAGQAMLRGSKGFEDTAIDYESTSTLKQESFFDHQAT